MRDTELYLNLKLMLALLDAEQYAELREAIVATLEKLDGKVAKNVKE
ncbi:MAG: hypothetical protein FWG45_00745 [Oscillospiraceae bacterium]|nr:hypothetical protein [Oscillospiraceae bacterium]